MRVCSQFLVHVLVLGDVSMHPSQSHHALSHISASSHQATAAKLNVCRMAFAAVQQLEPLANGVISVAAAALTKMKANCADAPYIFEKGAGGPLLALIVHNAAASQGFCMVSFAICGQGSPFPAF